VVHYVGVLDGTGDVWGVRVPDIPGCVGGGATPEAAISDAAEALRDVVAHKRDGGFPVPKAIDAAAVERGLTRSAFLASAARGKILDRA
jgi:predicted RNase H-like HicB family nuclease